MKLDTFYHDETYGVIKFTGYAPTGHLRFDRYERDLSGKWFPSGQRANLEPSFEAKRIKAGKVRSILPPA